MTTEPRSHHDAEAKNRALWDEIAPVHLKAYKEVALLREGRGLKEVSRILGLPRATLRRRLQEQGEWPRAVGGAGAQ